LKNLGVNSFLFQNPVIRVCSESFGFDTGRYKENNLRIHFDDTSSSASFAANDWRISINGSGNGDPSYFAIEDATGGRIPFRIAAGAIANALYVDADGDVGIGTATPVVEAHLVDGNTPTLRLQQDGSSGFGSQTWDMAGNETNFFIRDVTNGSKLPFRIRPGALESSIDIAANGEVGIGDASPAARLHIKGLGSDSSSDAFLAKNSSNVALCKIRNDGRVAIGDVSPEQELHVVGNVAISGSILPVSDIRLKKNIQSISNGLITIQALNPTTYHFRTVQYADMKLPETLQYGFIAQELEKVLPALVTNSDNPDKAKAFKRVNYTGVIPFLVKGMQEQQEIIEEQQAEIDVLKEKLNEIGELKQQVATLAKMMETDSSTTKDATKSAKK